MRLKSIFPPRALLGMAMPAAAVCVVNVDFWYCGGPPNGEPIR